MASAGLSHRLATTMRGAPPVKKVILKKESELRIELHRNRSLRLILLDGIAEIFGTELPPGNWITFRPGMKFAIFTWYGATIEMEDNAETDYVSDETPMITYVNVHAILENRRKLAKSSPSDSDASQGPRVMIVGPTDSGKSSLSRMLLSWAARLGRKPTFVDLDISQGSIALPGCIAATTIERPIDPVEGIPLDKPLVYFFGHNIPNVNSELHKVLVKELAQIMEQQFAGNAESRAAGMVIDTMGFVDGFDCFTYGLLLHAINTFKATVVLVLDQEKLCSILTDVLKGTHVDVVKLKKSGGVVSRVPNFRASARSQRIREYFYGLSNDLSPHSNIAKFSDLSIYKIGGPRAPASALPFGMQPLARPTRLIPVNITTELLNLVLAVSFAIEPDQILSSNIAGFIWITDVDIQRKRITYLAPSDEELPSKFLLMGSLTWKET